MKHCWGWVVLVIQVAALSGCHVSTSGSIGTTLLGGGGSGGGDSQTVTMPDVFLMSQADAEAALRRAGFERPPNIDTSLCGSVVEKKIVQLGQVCYQRPAAGQQTSPRVPVSIQVQTQNPYRGELGGGRFWFLMPDLVGTHIDKGRARLKELGFTVKDVKIAYVDRPGCLPNNICETFPEGLSRTDNTSDKLFYVGRPAELPKEPEPRATKPADPKPADPKPADPKSPPKPTKPDDIF